MANADLYKKNVAAISGRKKKNGRLANYVEGIQFHNSQLCGCLCHETR